MRPDEGNMTGLAGSVGNSFLNAPQSVTSYIASSSDSNTLRKLTLSAYHVESLQAFIDQIKKDDDKLM